MIPGCRSARRLPAVKERAGAQEQERRRRLRVAAELWMDRPDLSLLPFSPLHPIFLPVVLCFSRHLFLQHLRSPCSDSSRAGAQGAGEGASRPIKGKGPPHHYDHPGSAVVVVRGAHSVHLSGHVATAEPSGQMFGEALGSLVFSAQQSGVTSAVPASRR